MKSPRKISRVLLSAFPIVMFIAWNDRASGQVTPYSADPNTILLDHFDGATGASFFAYVEDGAACGSTKPSATPSYSYGTGPGGLNQCLTMNPPAGQPLGSATYLQYPGGQLLSQSNGTIEFWLYATSYGTGLALVEQGQYYGACSGWTFGLGVSTIGQLSASAWAAFSMTSGTATVPLNQWTHIAVTWGSAGAKLYINGLLVGSDVNTGMPASGYSGSVLVRAGTQGGVSASIDELRISNVQRIAFNVVNFTPASPKVTSFTPASGSIGTSVTISGTNFDSTASKNFVLVGGVKAPVSSGNSTSLTITIPTGVSNGVIAVLDSATQLSGYSRTPFNVTFASSRLIDGSSFAPKVDTATGNGPRGIAIADFDGDGKNDLAAANYTDNTVTFLQNVSIPGAVTFSTGTTIATGANPINVATADFDGDGKVDVVTTNSGANTVSILRNTSTPGALSFATKIDSSTGTFPYGVAVCDIDGDGKPDIVATNANSNSISILKNTSSGSISFATKVDVPTGAQPYGVTFADVNNDGLPDIVVTARTDNSITIYRNNSIPGVLSVASALSYTTGTNPNYVVAGDLDGDLLPDLATSNIGNQTVSVFRNMTSGGSISFATRFDSTTGSFPYNVVLGDFDGDGKSDLVTCANGIPALSVHRNTSTTGSISLLSNVNFSTSTSPRFVAVGDIDGDGKPDMVAANFNANTVSILRNTITVPSIISFGVDMSKQVALGQLQTGDTVMVRTFTGVFHNKILSVIPGTSVYRDTVSFGNATGPMEYKFWKSRGATDGQRYENAVGPVAPFGNRVDTATAGLKTISTVYFNSDSVIAVASVSPQSGVVGSSVTLTGYRFNPAASNNIVHFGAVKALVTVANTTSLTVTVPTGASYSPISVTDTVAHLTGFSFAPFKTTFPSSRTISSGSFASKVDFTGGTNPLGLVIADIDGDGKSDIVQTNYNSATVSVFRNTSTSGTINASSFAGKVDFTTGSIPYGAAVGDLDGDGKTDLVVANNASGTISVFRNTSTAGNITSGSFAAKVDFTAGTNPWGVAIADVDGDGKPDIIVTNNGSTTVSVFRNTSSAGSITSGSFAAKVDYATGSSPMGIAVADIDGDTKPDIVVANSGVNTLSVLMNLSSVGSISTGSFAAKVDFSTGSAPTCVAIGDLDGDGKPDVIVANNTNSSVSVLRNTSTVGTITTSSLAAKVDFTAGTNPYFLALGDADGDGKVDVAVTNGGSSTVSMFKNTSTAGSITTGSLAAQVTYFTATGPRGIDFSDLDGDGKPDFAVANAGSNSVSILRNTVSPPPPPIITSITPQTGAVGTSIIISGSNFNTVAAANKVFFGPVKATVTSASSTILQVNVPSGSTYHLISVTDTTTGLTGYSSLQFVPTFQSNQIIDASAFAPKSDLTAATNPWSIQAVDVDADGKTDLVAANDGANSLSFYRNTSSLGNITFATRIDSVIGQQPKSVAYGDLDGDGKQDFVTANQNANTLSIYRNTSSPGLISLAAMIALADTGGPFSAAIADMDEDGKPDLIVANIGANKVSVLRNSSTVGNLSFAAPAYFAANTSTCGVTVGDIDGDGLPDIVATNLGASSITVFRNTSTVGNISFSFGLEYSTGTNTGPWAACLGDLDLDGKLDIVVVNNTASSVSIFRNQSTVGTVALAPRQDQPVNTGPWKAVVGDINGDGKPDIIVAYHDVAAVSVMKNTSVSGSISWASKVDYATTNTTWGVVAADFDGDGKPDLAATNYNSSTISVLRNTVSNAPLAPTNLTATTASSSQINLSWTASAYGSPTLYRIFRSLTSGTGFSKIDSVSGSTTTYANTNLSSNTTYYYLVYAVNAGGQSAASNQASARTFVVVPSAPTNLTATAVSSTQINLSWTASSTGSPTLYRIHRSLTSGSGFSKIDSVSGSTTTYANAGLNVNTAYYYVVYAVNAGGQSAASNQAGAVTSLNVPSAPTNLTATAASSSQINLIWTASTTGSPTLYRIFRSLTSGTGFSKIDSVNNPTTTYANSGLSANTTYYYLVYAVNAGGQSASSNQANATTPLNATITVVTPPSNWATTYTHTISWSSQNLPGNVNIKLSLDNGSTFPATIVIAAANSGSYSWSVPSNQTLSNTCVLKVESYNYTTIYGLSKAFAIVSGANVSYAQPASVAATYASNPTSNNEYRLISFPGQTQGISVNAIGFNGNEGQDWRMFREPGNSSQGFIPMNGESVLETGEGYWFIQKGSLSANVSFNTPPIDNDATVSIYMTGGPYSIIGNPFNVPVPWSSVLSLNGLASNTPLFSWNGSWSSSSTSLQPGVGYYINSTGLAMLKIPYAAFGFPSQVAGESLKTEWQLQLAFESASNNDDDNYIGIAEGTSVGKDRYEFNKPPLIFDGSFLYMKRSNWDTRNDMFYTDYRPAIGDGQTWEFEITNPGKSLGKLTVVGIEKVPTMYNAYLVNEETGVTLNLRRQNGMEYGHGRTLGHFKVVVGPQGYVSQQLEQYMPREFSLEQNYPNPFNPSTTVTFKMPKEGSVRLEVFSLLGQRIKVLAEGTYEAGVHQVVWMGENDWGARVTSGVYFCRFVLEKKSVQTRKMLLTK